MQIVMLTSNVINNTDSHETCASINDNNTKDLPDQITVFD